MKSEVRRHYPRSGRPVFPTYPIDSMQQSSSPVSELPGVGFLSDVSSDHRAFLACFGKSLRSRNWDVLIPDRDAQESLYPIFSGTLEIVAPADDRQVQVAAFGERESIGQINLFDCETENTTAVGRSSGVIGSLSRDELEVLSAADPVAGVTVMRGLLWQFGKRIRSMNEKLETAEQRASIQNFWTSVKL